MRVAGFLGRQVNFLPLDITDEEDIALVLQHADYIIQYGEDIEPKQPKDEVSLRCASYGCDAADCKW